MDLDLNLLKRQDYQKDKFLDKFAASALRSHRVAKSSVKKHILNFWSPKISPRVKLHGSPLKDMIGFDPLDIS